VEVKNNVELANIAEVSVEDLREVHGVKAQQMIWTHKVLVLPQIDESFPM
jgi:hypothetical protein